MTTTPIVPDQGAMLRPPGLDAPGLMLPPSTSPQIATSQTAQALASQQVGDIAASMERAALYSGEIEKHFKSIRDQTNEMHRSTTQTVREVREGFQNPGYRPAPQSRGHNAHRTALPTVEGGAGGGRGGRGADLRFRDMSLGQGMEMGQDLSELRANVARRTNRWMSEWGSKYRPDTNAAGQYVDEAGNVTRASAKMGADWERGMSRIGRVQGVVNAVGEGQGLTGMLGKVGGRLAGPIGLALGAGMAVNNQMIDQRKKNAFYQNIYGGENSDQFGQRAQEWGFSHFGTAGLMDSGEATQLFRGVSSMGLQGDSRQRALDFATSQYRNTGMEVSTSLKLIQQATDNGVSSMTDFTDALAQVGEAAEKSHKPLKEAQEAFASTYAQLSGTFSKNADTSAIAGGLTAMQQGLGHRLGDLNLSGMVTGQQQQMMMASMMGVDPSQFMMDAQTNKGNVLGRGMNVALDRIRQQGLTPGSADLAKSLASAHKGPMNDDAFDEIGRQMMSQGGNNPLRVQAIAQQMGLNIPPADIPGFVARLALGDKSLDAEKIMGEGNKGNSFGDAAAHKIAGGNINTADDPLGIISRRQNLALAQELGIKKEGGLLGGSGWDSKSGKATDAYFDSLHESGGKRYKSIEKLIAGQGIGDDAKIRVKDKSGKDVDVTLEQAIKYHKDELEQGNLQITGGMDAGKTVGEVTGVYGKKDEAKKNPDTKVTLEAKGALKNFIDMQVSGGSSVDTARRTGSPAAAFPTSPWMLGYGAGN